MGLERWLPRRLKARFTLLALACAACIFGCTAPITIYKGWQLLVSRRVQELDDRIDGVVHRTDGELRAIRQETIAMIDVVQQWEPKGLTPWHALMERALHNLPEAYALRLGFPPGNQLGPRGVPTLYVRRAGTGFERQTLSYDPGDPGSPGAPWYNAPSHHPTAAIDGVWSPPFVAPETDGKVVLACAIAISREVEGRRLLDGVAAVDLPLETLLGWLSGEDLGSPYQVWILDLKGQVVGLSPKGSHPATSPSAPWLDLPQLRQPHPVLGHFVADHPGTGQKSHFFIKRLPNACGLLVFALPVQGLNRDLGWLTATVLGMGLLGMGGMALLFRWSAGRATRNLDVLRLGVERVQAGNLRESLPPPTGQDETGDVIHAFNGMVGELEAAFRRTEIHARQQQRLASELELAQSIQRSVLPGPIHPLGAALFSLTLPAQEVGGDFFDHFPLPGGKTAVAVGDVSGKGISAAMFMMRVSLLLRGAVIRHEPAEALAQVNGMLAEGNPQMMFVTLFLGIWDPVEQSLVYVNAGHNPPLVVRSDGQVETLEHRSGPALGVLRGRSYGAQQMALHSGDLLAIYTDGISEAPDEQGQQWGLSPMGATLANGRLHPLGTCAQKVVDQTLAWQGGEERFDDITLALLRVGEAASSLRLPATLESIESAVTLVRTCALLGGMALPAAEEMALGACEAVTNVITHALHEDPQRFFQLAVAWSEDNLVLRLEDPGPPFDPNALPPVDTTLPMPERPIGGLGWLLIRRVTDEIRMDRVGELNILTLVRTRHRPTMGSSHPENTP